MFENAAATGTLSGMSAPAAESIAVNVIEITFFAERWRADLLLGRLALAIGARLGTVDAGFSVSDVEPGGEADEWDLVCQWRQLNADANPPADKALHTVTAWFTGELKGAGDDVVETAVEDVSLAIILDALDGLAQAGVGGRPNSTTTAPTPTTSPSAIPATPSSCPGRRWPRGRTSARTSLRPSPG